MKVLKKASVLLLALLFSANVMAAAVGDVVTVTTQSGEVVTGTVAQVAADGTPLTVAGTGAAQGVTMSVATASGGGLVVTTATTAAAVTAGGVAAVGAAAGAVSATTIALAAAVVGAVAVVASNNNNTTTTTTTTH